MLGTRPSQPTRGQVQPHSDHLTEGHSIEAACTRQLDVDGVQSDDHKPIEEPI